MPRGERGHVAAYRLLVRLYPRDLRRDFGEEMVLVFSQAYRDRGPLFWLRAATDLLVSVPRYRLEAVMSRPATAGAVAAAAVAFGSLAALGLVLGGPIWAVGPVVLAAAVAFAQRSRIARALETPPSEPRRPGLRMVALACALAFLGAMASWVFHISTYPDLSALSVLLHNVVGIGSMVGLGVSAALALARRRSRQGRPHAAPR